jgi:hypothetical protein
MNTYLGISAELGPDDVFRGVTGNAESCFWKGYLFDKARARRRS